MTKRKLLFLILLFLGYALLVWVLSGLFFSDSFVVVGLILTVCGLTLLLVYILISRLTSRLGASPQAPGADTPPPAGARSTPLRDDESEPISSLIAEANDRLSKSPLLANSAVQPSVTALPLFLLLGAEGSGKTSMFLASDLLPELLAGEAYRESVVVPTRVLNLWFAGGCVVAEPSGRYFSEDPSRLQFVVSTLLGKQGASLFKKMFSKKGADQQLKGAILCCPIDSFLGVPDAARQAALVRRIQERLRSIGETLGMTFPVYVVFTKCDALPYFGDYFARLAEVEDKQVLGCTLPVGPATARAQTEAYADAQTKRLSDYFNRLYYSLAEQRTTFLRREADRAKKPPVYEFPRELKRIRGTLVQFLVDVFRPNPLQPGPLLRGFYFTGVRKVHTLSEPASRVKFSMTGTHKLGEATRLFRREDLQRTPAPEVPADASTSTTVWSFASDLLRQIIVSDRDRVGGAVVDRRLDLYRRMAFGSAIFLALLFIIVFAGSWFRNRGLLTESRQAGEQSKALARTSDLPSSDNLAQIENLRSVVEQLTTYRDHGVPWSFNFGLYAGKTVYPALHDLYFRRFREYFLDRIVQPIEARLTGLPRSQDPRYEYKSVYDDLKGYKTITTPEESRCAPDKEFAEWVVGSWRGNELVERQFNFYIRELRAKRDPYSDLHSAPAAIKNGRSYLAAYNGIDPIYNQIISTVNQEAQAVAKLSDYTARAPDTLILKAGSEVPAAFTRVGWDLVQKRIAGSSGGVTGNPCVVGLGQLATNLLQGSDTQRQLTNKYINDYIQHWRTFLASSTIQGYRNQGDAAHKLELLSGRDSPVLAVLAMTAENTKLTQDSSVAKNLITQAAGKAKAGIFDRILRRTPAAISNQVPAAQPNETLSPEKIQDLFQPTQVVFRSPNRQHLIDEVNTKYISALGDLQGAMNALAEQSQAQGNVELNNKANEKAQAALREARQLSIKFASSPEGVADTVATFLEAPIRGTSPLIVTDFGKQGELKLNGGLQALCVKLRSILGKYPFKAGAGQEVDLGELRDVFAPAGGAFWNFHREFTAKLLEQHGRLWAPKPDAEIKPNDRFLNFFNRMARISSALFPPDGDRPGMQYKLSMLPGSGYQSIKGSIDDQEFTSAVKQYTWPGAQKHGVDLRITPSGATATIPFDRHEGTWGLFRWMQGAEDHTAGPSVFGFVNQVRDSLGSRPQPILENGAAIRIQVNEFPGNIENVFDRDFFTGIDCPVRATQ